MAHVLYLDDEEALVLLVTRMLEHLGHKVSGHKLAAAALTAFENEPESFDLVLTDLNMAGMSGLEFAKRVMQIRRGAPVAIVTGHIEPKDRQTPHSIGVLAVVAKPNTLEEMSRMISELLAKAAAVRAAGE